MTPFEIPVDGGGEGGAVAVLLQTLFAVSNRTSVLTVVSGSGSFVDSPNTFAGTHDASDATVDFLGIGGSPGIEHATDRVQYTMQAATIPATSAISFVRVRIRAGALGDPAAYRVTPSINGFTRGTTRTLPVDSLFRDYSEDFAADPSDGQAWTSAKINAKAWGFLLDLDDTVGQENIGNNVSEFSIEVWGPTISGYTSYGVGRFDEGSPEAAVLPEVAAAIARGDNRYGG